MSSRIKFIKLFRQLAAFGCVLSFQTAHADCYDSYQPFGALCSVTRGNLSNSNLYAAAMPFASALVQPYDYQYHLFRDVWYSASVRVYRPNPGNSTTCIELQILHSQTGRSVSGIRTRCFEPFFEHMGGNNQPNQAPFYLSVSAKIPQENLTLGAFCRPQFTSTTDCRSN